MKHQNIKSLGLFCLIFTLHFSCAQNYTSYINGDTSDVKTSIDFGIVLAGGGTDNDDAMKWMLSRANGGDVLIIRASGADGYNEYFKNELGTNVNSVESIVFKSKEASKESYILKRMKEAEVIFLAGGDQTKYFDFWNDTEVEVILQKSLTDKSKIIGGTSAGMMILGNIFYAPIGNGAVSAEALANPYHSTLDNIQYNTFLKLPIFENTIFDSHFDNRSRNGRLITFMARAFKDMNVKSKAIACNESTAICIDENNIATAFGISPSDKSFVYFINYNCESNGDPQTVEQNKKLHWLPIYKNAVIVQRLKAEKSGLNKFDLNNWHALDSVSYAHWYVNDGVLNNEIHDDANCKELINGNGYFEINEMDNIMYPNPSSDIVNLSKRSNVSIYNLQGQLTLALKDTQNVDISKLSIGMYKAIVVNSGKRYIINLFRS